MKTLAVIGTAGRREDASKLDRYHWAWMCDAVCRVIAYEDVERLVSGGAAWADHAAVAVAQFTEMPLRLHLPGNTEDVRTSDFYHRHFSTEVFGDPLKSKWMIVACFVRTVGGSFKDRNTLVARDADLFLAMTFGRGANVKDGGTADTVNKMLAKGINGYHLDLNDNTLHKVRSSVIAEPKLL